MGVVNDSTWGNKGSNANWQLRVLQLLNQISAGVGGGGTPVAAVPYGPITSAGAGTIPANAKSYSIANIGIAAGIVNGGSLPVDIEVSYSAQDGEKFTAAVAYDATGTTFLITYIL
jgi:hypothetical protein